MTCSVHHGQACECGHMLLPIGFKWISITISLSYLVVGIRTDKHTKSSMTVDQQNLYTSAKVLFRQLTIGYFPAQPTVSS